MENEESEAVEQNEQAETQEEHVSGLTEEQVIESQVDYKTMVGDMKDMMGKMENRIEQLETSISTLIEAGVSINDSEIKSDLVEDDTEDTSFKRLEELDYNI